MKNLIPVVFLVMVGCNAATSSDGNPATSIAPILLKVAVREIHDFYEGACVDISFEGETMHINAVSPRGIGGTRIELLSGNWPKLLMKECMCHSFRF